MVSKAVINRKEYKSDYFNAWKLGVQNLKTIIYMCVIYREREIERLLYKKTSW